MLIKMIRVLTWDLLSCAQLPEAPLALPASADGFESRRAVLLYDLPTEHMQSKPLPRLHFFGRQQVHGCGARLATQRLRKIGFLSGPQIEVFVLDGFSRCCATGEGDSASSPSSLSSLLLRCSRCRRRKGICISGD